MQLQELYQDVVSDIINEVINRYFSLSKKRFDSYFQQVFDLSNADVNRLKKQYVNEHLPIKLNEINKKEYKNAKDYFKQIYSMLHSIQGDIIEFYTAENRKLKGLAKEVLDRSTTQSDEDENETEKEDKKDDENKRKQKHEKKKIPLWAVSIEIIKANYTNTFRGSNLEKLTNKALKILEILEDQIKQLVTHSSRNSGTPKFFTNKSEGLIKNEFVSALLSYFFKFLIRNPSMITRHPDDFKKIKLTFFGEAHKVSEEIWLPRLAYFAQIDNPSDLNKFMHIFKESLEETAAFIKKSDKGWWEIIGAGISKAYDQHDEVLDEIPSGKRQILCKNVFSDECLGSIDLYPNTLHLKTV